VGVEIMAFRALSPITILFATIVLVLSICCTTRELKVSTGFALIWQFHGGFRTCCIRL
jgi:hypothetical protein